MGSMHRVNQKQKRTTFLRFLAYGITVSLSIVTTITLLYVALGYRFDGSGHVVQNGLLLVDNRPQPARILLNDEEKDAAAPGRFVLPAGSYNLQLQRDGYRSWQKSVAIGAGSVRTVHYPLLFPEALKPVNVGELGSPTLVSQSLDKKQLLLHSENSSTFELFTLGGDAKSYTSTSLVLTAAIPRENNLPGTFRVIEWALNNKQLLLEQTLPSGAKNLLSYDITKPESVINITALYGDQVPSSVRYAGGKTTIVYGIKDGVLQRYSLEEARATLVMRDVRHYQPYGDDTVGFVRMGKSGTEAGVWKDDVVTVIHTYPIETAAVSLQYFLYDDHYYLALADAVSEEIVIYRDPIKKPIIASQLPYLTLTFAAGAKLSVGPTSQFLLAETDSSIMTYDFEDTKAFQFQTDIVPPKRTPLRWVTGNHLAFQGDYGSNYILEYDGTNKQLLQQSVVGRPALFSSDMEKMYEIAATGPTSLHLRMTPLTIE